jgi:hypothetical protein
MNGTDYLADYISTRSPMTLERRNQLLRRIRTLSPKRQDDLVVIFLGLLCSDDRNDGAVEAAVMEAEDKNLEEMRIECFGGTLRKRT